MSEEHDAITRDLREPEELNRTTLPGLRIEQRKETVDLQEHGNAIPNSVMICRDEIPEVIGVLIDAAREEDLEEIEARCRDALFWGDRETACIHVEGPEEIE